MKQLAVFLMLLVLIFPLSRVSDVNADTPFDFSLTSTVSSRTITALNSTTYPINITCVGTPQNVTLSCSTSILGVFYQFVPSFGYPPFASSLIVFTSSNTPSANYTLTIVGRTANLTRSTTVQLEVQPQSPDSKWIIQTINPPANAVSPSMTLDKSGHPYIAFGGSSLQYISWNGSAWNNQTVDSPGSNYSAGYVSLKLTSAGYPCIAFVNFSFGIGYTAWNGSKWLTQTVDEGAHPFYDLSLTLNSKDLPYIIYRNDEGDLKYAMLNGSIWNVTTVITGSTGAGAIETHLALDSHDNPHIVYVNYNHGNHLLKYAILNGSSWDIQTLGSCWGYTSFVLDSHDNPCIAYWGSNNKLEFTRWNGTSWLIQDVDSPQWGTTNIFLALDSNDHAHIAYRENSVDDLKYANWTGTSWSVQKIAYDTTPMSFAVGSKGYPHILCGSFGGLKYVTPFDFDVSSTVQFQSVKAGESATFPVDVTLSSEFTENVTLTCSHSIPDAGYQFALSVSSPTFSSVLEVQTGSDTPVGDYSIYIYATAGELTRVVRAQLEVEQIVVSDLQESVLGANDNTGYFIYANPNRMTRAVATYDVAAGSIVYGLCANPQNQAFDINSTLVSQDAADRGRLLLSNQTVLLFGGPNPHWVVKYLEDNNLAPIYFQTNGTNLKFIENSTGIALVEKPISGFDFEHEDYFVIESLFDENNNRIFVSYGFDWKGTWSAGIYLKNIYPNIQTYTNQYYIIHWVDVNVDGIPQANEMMTIST
jgi:hypothetical protein